MGKQRRLRQIEKLEKEHRGTVATLVLTDQQKSEQENIFKFEELNASKVVEFPAIIQTNNSSHSLDHVFRTFSLTHFFNNLYTF